MKRATGASFLAIVLSVAACDSGRVVDEVGNQGTRAVHTRDRVESDPWMAERVPDAGDAPPATPLEPVGETGLALGTVEVVAESEKMALERQEWSFEGVRGVAFRVRIDRDAADLGVLHSEEVVMLDQLVRPYEGDFVAINGGFYDVDSSAMGLVVSDGEEHAPKRTKGGSGIILEHDDEIAIVHRETFDGEADEALQSIDRIVAGGESLMTEGRRERHTARSAVAVGEEHLWFVIAIEEESVVGEGNTFQLRSTSFRGLPLWAFALYLLETTDTVDALNLDGAVSTQMIARVGDATVRARGERGTINAVVGRPETAK